MAMKPQVRAAITGGVIVLVGVIALTLRTLTAAGVFTEVTPAFDGTCKAIAGIAGPEDLQIDEKDRLVFVSATDRRAFSRSSGEAGRPLYAQPRSSGGRLHEAGGRPARFSSARDQPLSQLLRHAHADGGQP